MRTIERYIATLFVKNYALAISALSFLFVFHGFLTAMLDGDFPVRQLLVHHGLLIPQTVTQLTPPAVLIATVFTLAGLNRTNELVAAFSIGMGLTRVVAVILAFVFMISCLMLVMQDHVLPPVYRKRTTHYWRVMKKREDFYFNFKQDRIWYRSRNLIYNLRAFDRRTQSITGMAVYDFDPEFRLRQLIEAERAEFSPSGWRLLNGTVTTFSGEDPFPRTQRFDERSLLIHETPKDFMEIEKEVDGLRVRQLAEYVDRTRAAGVDTKAFEVKLQSRISLSFIPLVMCVLAVPFATRNRRSGGAGKDLGICLALTFFYWIFFSVGLSLGTNGAVPPVVAAWFPSAVFAVLAGGLILRRQRSTA
jgi:lipopolysaccharide export system permease protein